MRFWQAFEQFLLHDWETFTACGCRRNYRARTESCGVVLQQKQMLNLKILKACTRIPLTMDAATPFSAISCNATLPRICYRLLCEFIYVAGSQRLQRTGVEFTIRLPPSGMLAVAETSIAAAGKTPVSRLEGNIACSIARRFACCCTGATSATPTGPELPGTFPCSVSYYRKVVISIKIEERIMDIFAPP